MKLFSSFAIFLAFLLCYSCSPDDDFITDSGAKLEFSVDTLRFDTVFTSLGSATRILKIFNRNDQPIRIDKIMVEGGSNSPFRLNIDGDPGEEAENVEIPANDSLYIFGEVTIDPNQPLSISPFVIEDNLIFITNGNTQTVLLEAWGQNANYIPSRFNQGGIAVLSCNLMEEVWDDPKPYVIYGILFIDDCTLVLPPGTRIHIHGGFGTTYQLNTMGDSIRTFYNDGRIIVGQRGRLIANGTAQDSVVFQGDRLEDGFQDVEGQWFGIIVSAGSRGSVLNHTTIKNSIIGIAADSASTLRLNETKIFNTSSSGLLGIHAQVDVRNSLFYNNAAGAVRLVYGGDYNFDYCTLASYGVDASALTMGNSLCLDPPLCSTYRPYRLNVRLRNSIVFGSRRDEIGLSAVPEAAFNYDFQNCIVKVDELLDPQAVPDFFDQCDPCINADRNAVLFFNVDESNYHLDTLSIAEEMAAPISGISLDLDGENRDGATPDIGCYEYIYD